MDDPFKEINQLMLRKVEKLNQQHLHYTFALLKVLMDKGIVSRSEWDEALAQSAEFVDRGMRCRR